MHGRGIFTSSQGYVYTGEFKYGKPSGLGKLVYDNGDRSKENSRMTYPMGRESIFWQTAISIQDFGEMVSWFPDLHRRSSDSQVSQARRVPNLSFLPFS
jgi:hypothetical protein